MAAAKPIEFWFTMGSTYTYLTVMRLPELEKASGIPFRWRPFHLLTILQEMKHVPFADKPAKAAYMSRDIERRAQMVRDPPPGAGALPCQAVDPRQSGGACAPRRRRQLASPWLRPAPSVIGDRARSCGDIVAPGRIQDGPIRCRSACRPPFPTRPQSRSRPVR